MIIGQHKKRICYVDCFAGPWQVSSPTLEDSSISISLKIMQSCREALRSLGKAVEFRALFIEEDDESFDKLKRFLKENPHFEIETTPLHGKFNDLQNNILKWCGTEDFTFFFIDPTGWKDAVEIPTLRPLLQRPNSEYLINFMYDFILRAVTQEPFKKDMKKIFGEVPETSGMEPEQREEYLLKRYRENLKEAQPRSDGKPRSAYVKVLDPYKERTKYHLVYLTRHPKGITVFMEASEKLKPVQETVRAQTKQDRRIAKSGQGELFSAERLSIEKEKVNLPEVKDYWLKILTPLPRRFGIAELADMLEETGWFISDFQMAFGELENEGKVKNLDRKEKPRSKFVHFEKKGERLKKII